MAQATAEWRQTSLPGFRTAGPIGNRTAYDYGTTPHRYCVVTDAGLFEESTVLVTDDETECLAFLRGEEVSK